MPNHELAESSILERSVR